MAIDSITRLLFTHIEYSSSRIVKTFVIHRRLQLLTFAGVQATWLERDRVVGTFKMPLVEIGGEKQLRLIETFLNWPDDAESILRFARMYGPLEVVAEPGEQFSFASQAFRDRQSELRDMWRQFKRPAGSPLDLLHLLGGTIRFHTHSITYMAPSLYAYLYVDLLSSPVKRVRVCKRPACFHPYFTAGHLRQRFCCDKCAEEGQREWKRAWWKKHGSAWREKRSER